MIFLYNKTPEKLNLSVTLVILTNRIHLGFLPKMWGLELSRYRNQEVHGNFNSQEFSQTNSQKLTIFIPNSYKTGIS